MKTLIVRKIHRENLTSIVKIIHFKHKWLNYKLAKWYYTKKGFNVEETEGLI